MQTKDFNQLMEGKEAQFIPNINPGKLNMESKTPINEQINELIEKNKVPIPNDLNVEIQSFITKLKDLKIKDAEIRRRVKIRFNITTV